MPSQPQKQTLRPDNLATWTVKDVTVWIEAQKLDNRKAILKKLTKGKVDGRVLSVAMDMASGAKDVVDFFKSYNIGPTDAMLVWYYLRGGN